MHQSPCEDWVNTYKALTQKTVSPLQMLAILTIVIIIDSTWQGYKCLEDKNNVLFVSIFLAFSTPPGTQQVHSKYCLNLTN